MSTFMINLQSENQKLKADMGRLTNELEQRDKLIASLEFQIQALLTDQSKLTPNARHGSGTSSRSLDMTENKPIQEISRSLMPPSRSTVEMESPLAPEEEDEKVENEEIPRTIKQVKLVSFDEEEGETEESSEANNKTEKNEEGDSDRPVLKAGLTSSRSAIRSLPHEISIANDDDDEVTKYSADDSSPTFKVNMTQMFDAYMARGIYTGVVSRREQMPHGKGKMEYHHAGKLYEGDWHLGHWHGKGTIRTAEGIYTGEVVNDRKEGTGEMVYTDGHKVNGTFKQDDPVDGTVTYVDKKEYVGQLKNGVWHGKGTLSYPDGSKYVGEFHNGVQHGKGVYNFSDDSVYEGESVMGAYEGRGKMTWSDGGWYEGDWKQGEANGHGMEIRPDGRLRHHGAWRKGVPVRQ
jgi:hypothetical protein